MSAFYTRLEATARRLIDKYGKAEAIVRISTSGPAHNPTTSETVHDCRLVEIGYSLTNRNETLIRVGDKLGLISTDLAVVPELPDKITIGGTRYNLVDLQPLNPGGTTLFYEFVARA